MLMYNFTQSFSRTIRWCSRVSGIISKSIMGFGLLMLFLFATTSLQAQTVVPCINGNSFEWGTPQLQSEPTYSYRSDVFTGNQDDIYTGSKDFKLFGDNNNSNEYNEWTLSPMQAKSDIMNAAAVILTGLVNDPDCELPDGTTVNTDYDPAKTYLFFAGDRESNNGVGYIGFWFLINGTSATTNAGGQNIFYPAHTIGDLLVLADFENGGRQANITILRWVGPGNGTAGNNLSLLPIDVSPTTSIAQNNGGTTPVPAGFSVPAGQVEYDYNEFYEGVIDLTDAFDGLPNPPTVQDLCNATWMLETRSSKEITADLKDFVGGDFNLPFTIEATGDEVCENTSASLSATLFKNNGEPINNINFTDQYIYTWSGPSGVLPDDFPGQGTNTIEFNSVTLADEGLYSVTVSGPGCLPDNPTATATLNVLEEVTFSCPDAYSDNACNLEANTFSDWLAGFTVTPGDTPVTVTYMINGQSANDLNNVSLPDACDGVVSITMTVDDECTEPTSCSSSFTVEAAPAVTIVQAPQNDSVSACDYQEGDFGAWIAAQEAALG
ncbi:hypothetical protein, partial [Aestuariivivens sediminicola]|uniref:hypothetical protein n=1 Tax=Aestuariivivens sediminicola TaxID=2913560 RepID=UPI001F5846A4